MLLHHRHPLSFRLLMAIGGRHPRIDHVARDGNGAYFLLVLLSAHGGAVFPFNCDDGSIAIGHVLRHWDGMSVVRHATANNKRTEISLYIRYRTLPGRTHLTNSILPPPSEPFCRSSSDGKSPSMSCGLRHISKWFSFPLDARLLLLIKINFFCYTQTIDTFIMEKPVQGAVFIVNRLLLTAWLFVKKKAKEKTALPPPGLFPIFSLSLSLSLSSSSFQSVVCGD